MKSKQEKETYYQAVYYSSGSDSCLPPIRFKSKQSISIHSVNSILYHAHWSPFIAVEVCDKSWKESTHNSGHNEENTNYMHLHNIAVCFYRK